MRASLANSEGCSRNVLPTPIQLRWPPTSMPIPGIRTSRSIAITTSNSGRASIRSRDTESLEVATRQPTPTTANMPCLDTIPRLLPVLRRAVMDDADQTMIRPSDSSSAVVPTIRYGMAFGRVR